MHSQATFFAAKKLNDTQERSIRTFAQYGLTAAHLEECDWFNDHYHYLALQYLLEKKKMTLADSLAILDKLNKEQAEGIFHGLKRENVLGLNGELIKFVLKFGLSNKDVSGLNQYQIQAKLSLNKYGLTDEMIRKATWFKSDEYVSALKYLVIMENLLPQDALNELHDVNEIEAWGISQGFSKEEVIRLTKSDINMLKELSHWGLTGKHLRAYALPDDYRFRNALKYLLCDCFLPVEEALLELQGLDKNQAEGISLGFTRYEVTALNIFQILALKNSKDSTNNISATNFLKYTWFNSHEHVNVFGKLIRWDKFTFNEAMSELEGLDSNQLKQIYKGERKDNIFDLTPWQLKSVEDLKCQGLKGSHLRGKDWFDHSNHYFALIYLMNQKCMKVEAALALIDGFTADQARLITEYPKDIIQKLTPIQIKILADGKIHLSDSTKEAVLNSPWLNTEEHYQVFATLYNLYFVRSEVMTILTAANQEKDGVKKLHDKVQTGFTRADYDEFKRNSNRRGCSVM